MTKLTSRLNRLERASGGGACTGCKGLGRHGYICRFSTEPEGRPYGGCERCGRFSAVFSKIIIMPDDFDEAAAFPTTEAPRA